MRFLLIYCNPVETSFGAALHQATLRGLEKAGHDVDDCDLYAEGFQAAMSPEERRAYHQVDQNTENVSEYVRRLQNTEGLVFIYPTWWSTLPAMLKGYFERVWLPGVAFDLANGGINPKLRHIGKLAVVTTYGSPWWAITWEGNAGKRFMFKIIKSLCQRSVRIEWLAMYNLDRSTPAQRTAFLQRVEAAMARF